MCYVLCRKGLDCTHCEIQFNLECKTFFLVTRKWHQAVTELCGEESASLGPCTSFIAPKLGCYCLSPEHIHC